MKSKASSMRHLLAPLIALAFASAAHAQFISNPGTVTTTGAVTTGDCAKFLTSTVIQDAGAACGGSGGSPGGSNTQLQYNNSGAFGGAAGLTTDGTNLIPGSSSLLEWNSDTILSRKAAASLNLGAADAASPVAQTLGVQSVVAGTTNTAGQLWKFSDSAGTGTGASGGFAFVTHPAGSTGTGQNAGVTALTISPLSGVTYSGVAINGCVVGGGVDLCNSNVFLTGSISQITNKFALSSLGILYLNTNAAQIQFGSATDVALSRRAAANLEIGYSDAATAVAQTLSVQNVIAGTPNAAGANWTLTGSQGTGTGVGGSIIFQTAKAGTTGTSQNALANALTLNGADGSVTLAGTKPTLTGTCTTGSQLGGASAGSFTATCTAGTVIMTFLTTAPNGWACFAQDETTPANTLKQSADNTTSCTLTGTTVAADKVVFHAFAY